jgi:hypothetical protein
LGSLTAVRIDAQIVKQQIEDQQILRASHPDPGPLPRIDAWLQPFQQRPQLEPIAQEPLHGTARTACRRGGCRLPRPGARTRGKHPTHKILQ